MLGLQKIKIESNVDVKQMARTVNDKYKDDAFFKSQAIKLQKANETIDDVDLIDIIESMRLCLDCEGLHACKQKLNGYLLGYHNDSVNRVACKYRSALQQKEDYFNKMVYSSTDLPAVFKTFNDLDITSNRQAIVKEISNIKQNINQKGILLSGSPGAGKTFIMETIIDYYLTNNYKVAYVSINDLILKLNTLYYSFNSDDKVEFNRLINKLKKVEYLFIDDLGAEKIDAFSRDDVLFPILDYRMKNQKLTYFTSNYSLAELKDHYQETSSKIREPIKAERLVERIRVLADEFILKEKQSRR